MNTLNYSTFPQNKYTTWYINLIDTRRFQEKTKFKTEAHHIFPVSIFGKNSLTVNLTHREHYISHLLLWRIFEENTKEELLMTSALHALQSLSNDDNKRELYKMNSYVFEKYRGRSQVMNSKRTQERWDNDAEFREKITKSKKKYKL